VQRQSLPWSVRRQSLPWFVWRQSFLQWKTGREKFVWAADADELGLPFIFVEPPSLSRRVVNQAQ
jgi:hypothetical protein